ncbi:roadblock/LC7 domain-containing protein [Pseudolysobacter antarcticus]|uniref:Roadblock/LC7 domain-containing protein n=1 Tax=Pseudolysobacter antarcticus TaxID=2511995 RepID=A0A411HLX2_9GAMM|nr:roadblock/LC7 domain-containing protein [Pseudolysobacter antarcticus]QBB71532.1 roadblock/LC7 domain-containing protein [Pseudolysobacter antarcticus]
MTPKWTDAQIKLIREQVDAEMSQFAAKMTEVQTMIVSTSDGRPLTAFFSTSGDKNRIGAMISSLLAVCETASRELVAGRCLSAIVSAENANVVVLRVGGTNSQFVLAVAFDAKLMLGTALRMTHDFGDLVARIVATPF